MSAIASFPEQLHQFEALLGEAADQPRPPLEAIVRAIRFAESLVVAHPDEADAHQMLGLAWYHYPSSASFRSWRCRESLQRALALEPDHQYALQFLAYLAFDQERYDDALSLQARLRDQYFIERDQEWRALKNLETRVVCQIRLDRDSFPTADFTRFANWYRDARSREDSDYTTGSYAHPQELRECAEWLYENGAPLDDSRLSPLLTFLAEIDYLGKSWTEALVRQSATLRNPGVST